MSKNFETEYKKYADNTVPDLWSRIEAGVDAYEDSIRDAKTGSEETKTGKIVNIEDYSKKTKTEIKSEIEVRSDTGSKHVSDKKRAKVINYKPYIGALAAAACMFLVVVVMKNVLSSSNSAASAESAAAPAAMDSAPAAMEEAAEPMAEADAEAADTYEEEAEEAYDEAAEYTADASADENKSYEAADDSPEYEVSDESTAYEASDADTAYETSGTTPAYGEVDATPMEEAPMADVAASNEPDDLDAVVNGSEKYAFQSSKGDRNKNQQADRKLNADVNEIKLVCEPEDLSGLKDKGKFTAKITDPLKSGIKKGTEITVNFKKDTYESLFDALKDSKSQELTLNLTPEKDGTFTLVSVETKK